MLGEFKVLISTWVAWSAGYLHITIWLETQADIELQDVAPLLEARVLRFVVLTAGKHHGSQQQHCNM